MDKYKVEGMSCSACAAGVEKAVKKIAGVTECTVSLLTGTMLVEAQCSPQDIIDAVSSIGYTATLHRDVAVKSQRTEAQSSQPVQSAQPAAETEHCCCTGGCAGSTTSNIDESSDGSEQNTNHHSTESPRPMNTEIRQIRGRLTASVIFLIPLMYISMGCSMLGWPLPKPIENYMAAAMLQMLIAIVIMFINKEFFIRGFGALRHKNPNMDTLVALGAAASFGYSLYVTFAMAEAVTSVASTAGADMAAQHLLHQLYYESAAMILTLITLGKLFEAYSKGKTTNAITSLMAMTPREAVVIRNGQQCRVAAAEVLEGEFFVVKPGESIPVDGIVLEGSSAVDESSLTGESIPAEKQPDDTVSAATINKTGHLKCRAVRVGKDTTIAQIIELVENTVASKAPIARLADKVSGVFVPFVIAIALLTVAGWIIAGQDAGFAVARGVSVLVISCPCALGLATPVAIMAGSGKGAGNGILFKSAEVLEEAGKAKIVALDKTGTITEGKPRITDVIAANGGSESELLQVAYALEKLSEHPLASAVVEYGENQDMQNTQNTQSLRSVAVEEFAAVPGQGVRGRLLDKEALGGNLEFVMKGLKESETGDYGAEATVMTEGEHSFSELEEQGKTLLHFSLGGRYLGALAAADVIRSDSREAVQDMKDMGINVVMLTGDNPRTARTIGKSAGISRIEAEVMPQDKAHTVSKLQKEGAVIMVGDGINDAPALTTANIGMTIGAAADIAVDAADVVLMKNTLKDVVAAIKLSRATLRNIRENLFWAFIYNVLGIPLAAGVLYGTTGLLLNPMIAAATMSLSSVCVVLNALRLNRCKF